MLNVRLLFVVSVLLLVSIWYVRRLVSSDEEFETSDDSVGVTMKKEGQVKGLGDDDLDKDDLKEKKPDEEKKKDEPIDQRDEAPRKKHFRLKDDEEKPPKKSGLVPSSELKEDAKKDEEVDKKKGEKEKEGDNDV